MPTKNETKVDNTVNNGDVKTDNSTVNNTITQAGKYNNDSFNDVDDKEVIRERVNELIAEGAESGTVRIDSVGIYIKEDTDILEDSRIGNVYTVRFAGIRGTAFLFEEQIARLIPFGVDVQDEAKVRNVLKLAKAEIIRADIAAGEEFRFNLYSDKLNIANKDRTIIYVTRLKFSDKFMERIVDRTVDSLF